MANRVVIAQWPVGAESYKEMYEEALSDASIFMVGISTENYWVEVVNCQPEKFEASRVVLWKGNAIITMLDSQTTEVA